MEKENLKHTDLMKKTNKLKKLTKKINTIIIVYMEIQKMSMLVFTLYYF